MSAAARGCAWLALLAAVVAGCAKAPSSSVVEAEEPAVVAGTQFDPATAGSIVGRVLWEGAIPVVDPFRAAISSGVDAGTLPRRDWPNPLAPQVAPTSRGVSGAVVYLRGIAPERGRPWDHPPVFIEIKDFQIRLGDAGDRTRFVRRGDSVAVVSRVARFESLQFRGADFFAMPLPDADEISTRRLKRAGLVELRSGAGRPWMRGHLFVDDHPYYALTDSAGRFVLPQTPPGEYEVVCWHPNWQVRDFSRDTETALVARVDFEAPVEKRQKTTVGTGQTAVVQFTLAVEDFAPQAGRAATLPLDAAGTQPRVAVRAQPDSLD